MCEKCREPKSALALSPSQHQHSFLFGPYFPTVCDSCVANKEGVFHRCLFSGPVKPELTSPGNGHDSCHSPTIEGRQALGVQSTYAYIRTYVIRYTIACLLRRAIRITKHAIIELGYDG